MHNECIVKEGKLRADVRKGGDPNHPVGHAHIYYGSDDLASVDMNGKILAGRLSGKALTFLRKNLPNIARGIKELYYIGRE